MSPGAGSGGFQPQCQAGDGLLHLGPSALRPPPLPSPGPSHPAMCAWDPTPHTLQGVGGAGGIPARGLSRAGRGAGGWAAAIQSGLRPWVVASEHASVSPAFSAGRLRRRQRVPTPGHCTTTLISLVSVPARRPRGAQGPCRQPSYLGPAPRPSLTVQPEATSPEPQGCPAEAAGANPWELPACTPPAASERQGGQGHVWPCLLSVSPT